MTSKWIPEIAYEEVEDGITSNIPFVAVPPGEKMPPILYIFESTETGEFEPGPEGEDLPVTDLFLHQYADMEHLRATLSTHEYDIVRLALGLEPLAVAAPAGRKITENIRQNLSEKDPGASLTD